MISALTESTAVTLQDAGRKLLDLLPRMLFGSQCGLTGEPASRHMRQRCVLFKNGNWSELFKQIPSPLTSEARNALVEELNAQRGFEADAAKDHCIDGIECGRISVALQRLRSKGSQDPETGWNFLKTVHFVVPTPDLLALTPVEQLEYDRVNLAGPSQAFVQGVKEQLESLLPTLPKGVGAGPSGLRYEHIVAMMNTAEGTTPITALCLELIKGNWPDGERRSRLSALKKEDDPADGSRPIASGGAIRRATGRAAVQHLSSTIEDLMLAAHILSFSSDGCQVAYNLIRHRLATDPEHVCIEGDESTAFQKALRSQMRRELLAHLPDLIPFFEGVYGRAAGLHYNERTLPESLSQHGAQQGCPLGTLLFCLARRETLCRDVVLGELREANWS